MYFVGTRKDKEAGNVMQKLTDLMQTLNVESFPERWESFYVNVMKEYDTNGCIYTNPLYYEEINRKYNCLDKYLDVYMKAAEKIGKNKNLSRFLMLLCYAIKDRDNFKDELKSLDMPKPKDGSYSFEYEIMPGLAIASMSGYMYDNMKKRGIPDNIICETVASQQCGIKEYRRRNNGKDGYLHFGWNQLYIDGELFRIGSLEYQINHRFIGKCRIFEDNHKNLTALAHDITLHKNGYELGSKYFEDKEGSYEAYITETDKSYEGYPFDDNGYAKDERILLSKSEWTPVMQKDDYAVSVHIPSETDFSPESVDKSISKAKDFLAKYYPEYQYKAFVCISWLMDSALPEILKPDSNIVSFNKRFKKITTLSYGEGVLGFVFLKNAKEAVIAELPENTGLEKALKKYYLSGKVIYEMIGYFIN